MRKPLAPISPALIVAMAALVVAVVGAGYASHRAGPGQRLAAAPTHAAAHARRGPRGPRGKRGPRGFTGSRGPAGLQGSQGPQGVRGASGAPAFGALLGRGVNVPMGSTFLAPSGQLAADANQNNVSSFTPNAPLRASDLAVTLSVATGLTDTRTFTLSVGNADTALTCTVPPGNPNCTSSGSVIIPPASLIAIHSTSTGSPMATDVRFGWRATSD